MNELVKNIVLEYDAIVSYIYSRHYQCKNESLILLLMLMTSNNSMTGWYGSNEKTKSGKPIYNIDEFKKMHGNNISDYITLLNIFNKFRKNFIWFKMFDEKFVADKKRTQNDFITFKEKFAKLKMDIQSGKINEFDIPSDIDKTKYLQFNRYYRENKLSLQTSLDDYYKNDISLYELINKEIDENEKGIVEWCNRNFVNFDTLKSFLITYGEYYKKFLGYEENNLFNWTDSKLVVNDVSDDINENIIKSFIHGYGWDRNITYYNPEIKAFKNIKYKLTGMGDYQLKTIIPNVRETTLANLISWIMFGNKSMNPFDEKLYITILSNINIEWMIHNLPHVYAPYQIVKGTDDTNEDVLKQNQIINKFDIGKILYLEDIKDPVLQKYFRNLIEYIKTTMKDKYGQIGGKLNVNDKILKIRPNKLLNSKYRKYVKNMSYNEIANVDTVYVNIENNKIAGLYSLNHSNDHLIINALYSKNEKLNNKFMKTIVQMTK